MSMFHRVALSHEDKKYIYDKIDLRLFYYRVTSCCFKTNHQELLWRKHLKISRSPKAVSFVLYSNPVTSLFIRDSRLNKQYAVVFYENIVQKNNNECYQRRTSSVISFLTLRLQLISLNLKAPWKKKRFYDSCFVVRGASWFGNS